jgi:hypothetical protein
MSYAASPIFFLMAFVTYFQAPLMCTVPGEFGFLSTMWLMYAIMGAVHAGPWFSLVWAPLKIPKARVYQVEQDRLPESCDS